MKKIIAIILSVLLCLGMVGCGGSNKVTENSNTEIVEFHGVSCSVPSDWILNDEIEDSLFYYSYDDNDNLTHMLQFTYSPSIGDISTQMDEYGEGLEETEGITNFTYEETSMHENEVQNIKFGMTVDGIMGTSEGIVFNINSDDLFTAYVLTVDGYDNSVGNKILNSIKIPTIDVGEAEQTSIEPSMPKPNTSDMVDYIAREAKKSANSPSTEKTQDAIFYIRDNYPNYFDSNEKMENMMKYGYYLEYAYSKNGPTNSYANLGMDACQVVKYVYRNSETKDSDHTQANLRQIKKALEDLPLEYRDK